jgi:hypothetical protein
LRSRGPSALLCAALACACAADPEEAFCPEAGAGDLVVTEIRGEQTGEEDGDQWFEVQNQTGIELDLYGTVIDLLSIDGNTRQRMLIRRSVPVAPGGYAVLGVLPDSQLLAHMDYGFGADYETEADGTVFPTAGAVTVTGCGVELDRAVFDDLPATGTLSLDDAGTWCANPTPSGTPGEANPPCP